MSITDFILARVAEDEERAREALKPSDIDVFMDEKRSFYTTVGAHRDDWGLYTFNVPVERVLAECAAERRIVLSCSEMQMSGVELAAYLATQTIRTLALVYADHPDFRPEWR